MAEAERALDASAAWLGEIERVCSRFLPESELCALNASAGRPFAASDDFYAVVACAIEMAKRTDGLFDPTILPALLAAGYTRSFDEIGQREIGSSEVNTQATSDWRSGRWREIQLDATARTITIPAGVALDLGGVAKGWAADEVASRFLSAFPAYLIDLGGDLRLRGEPEPGKGWLIGIEDPRATPGPGESATEPRYLAAIELRYGGIATSGPARRWWLRDGQRMNHLIDPVPASRWSPAWISAPCSPARFWLQLLLRPTFTPRSRFCAAIPMAWKVCPTAWRDYASSRMERSPLRGAGGVPGGAGVLRRTRACLIRWPLRPSPPWLRLCSLP